MNIPELDDFLVADTSPPLVPGWVRLSLLDTLARFHSGRARICRHRPRLPRCASTAAPTGFAVAHLPDVVVCRNCFRRGVLDAPHRGCDACGRAGDADDPIRLATVCFNGLAFRVGVCADCDEF